ncbi:PepSY domain-containing protein [Cupriavidus sp. SW-Y-13]|uniref:PepSY domain-containing protein n=1 Tax=Cupriavidus sp. SW-Y-13 TaxID=2653854 RepID=UPI001365E5DE|nr:PepSY domain-containing protein [Cupriavidus sp. SW-Y-13]MWL89871.1 hypothetical protein [Cupriavidus sp. SW-Y-13]
MTSPHLSFLPHVSSLSRLARTGVLVAMLGVAGMAGPAHADPDADRARAALRSGEILPLSRILDTVARQYTGDVIDVKLDRDDGVWTYEVKLLLPTSSVAKLEYDARDGRLIKAKGRDLDSARKP